ncbi:DNA-binding transcriptional LysR family regulator [Rhodovulum iodosum]|uniref:DNA-binding transcriptional LysR family regulator n=1 Tax=Rhodovulum iodosum TaxID=68291 RepID=A0ABV3XPR5_9RHOB|nr:LysR family transcriptional regulator [Rhodovulum robiginosum]RSK31411.1 LysR family transcriptional regulator [Rhodovulum robiginosum]
MTRNLDLTALRSFVAVSEAGGVTRAAGFLNLTQSAVSMQVKRLEEALDQTLLDRSARTVSLTAAGEQLLGYAKRMLALNDEVYARMTAKEYEGEIVLGVPHDIVYPAIPQVLNRFNTEYPRVKVQLMSSYTTRLRTLFARGKVDIILTTEDRCGPGGETLTELPLVWVGAIGGSSWKQRPLKLAYEHACIFRKGVQAALDAEGIAWEMAVESESIRTVEASVSADLAVHTVIEGALPPYVERIQHGGALPELTSTQINLYVSDVAQAPALDELAALIRRAYALG